MLLGEKHLLVAPDFSYRRPCIRRIQDNISYNEGLLYHILSRNWWGTGYPHVYLRERP
jgi:hypothetical protein